MPRGDRGGKSSGSGIRCVAAHCGNTHKDGYSMHSFPKDPTLRRQWVDFVKVKRVDWNGPTEYSAICSDHFTMDCFPFRFRFELEQMGRKPKKVQLNSNAVPSVHATPVEVPIPLTSSKKRKSDNKKTPSAIPKTPRATREASNSTTPKARSMPHPLEMLSPSEGVVCQSSPPKRVRRGYAKRETARLIAEHNTVHVPADQDAEKITGTVDSTEDDIDLSEETTCVEEASEFIVEEHGPKVVTLGTQYNFKPSRRSKFCQTNIKSTKVNPEKDDRKKMVNKGTQTDYIDISNLNPPPMKDDYCWVRPEHIDQELAKPLLKTQKRRSNSCGEEDPMSSPFKDSDVFDPTYEPTISSDSSENEQEIENNHQRNMPAYDMAKYIVFEANLLELFDRCRQCLTPCRGKINYVNGSLVKISYICSACEHTFQWFSQPIIGGKPAGNLSMSSAILLSGSIPSKVLRMYNFMNISCISMSTYMNHQKYYIFPSVGHVWFNFQQDYVHDVLQSGRSVILGGDGRCDTPGHCAKYGSYNMVDLDEGVVADIQLVQSNEVPNSHHMEKAGLVRSVEFFRHHNIPIQTVVTDGHKMIGKWIRENMPETTHNLDVWHVAKGLKKKLAKLSLEKDCHQLQPWIKSIINHLYWTAASSLGQDKDVVVGKWYSILNHIINIHDGHGEEFPACQHGPLEGRERHKKWLKAGTKVYEKLQGIVCHWQLKKDVAMLSSGKQTSALEGYHSVINHFAPKMIGFSYHGMLCRLWLAALHFNENSQREQATTKDGRARYKVVYPKFKKGDYSVKRILVDCTYDYVKAVMTTVMGLGAVSHMNEDGVQLLVEVPPPLCSEFTRPDKETAVQNLMSRFNVSHCPPRGNQCNSGQGTCS